MSTKVNIEANIDLESSSWIRHLVNIVDSCESLPICVDTDFFANIPPDKLEEFIVKTDVLYIGKYCKTLNDFVLEKWNTLKTNNKALNHKLISDDSFFWYKETFTKDTVNDLVVRLIENGQYMSDFSKYLSQIPTWFIADRKNTKHVKVILDQCVNYLLNSRNSARFYEVFRMFRMWGETKHFVGIVQKHAKLQNWFSTKYPLIPAIPFIQEIINHYKFDVSGISSIISI